MKEIKKEQFVWHQMKTGQKNALSVLFKKYYPELYGYGMQFLQNDALVKDAIQELFYTIWNRREKLGDAVNVKSYLLSSLRRQILLLRNVYDSSELSIDDTDALFQFQAEEFSLPDETLKLRLLKTINELTPKQREVVYLRFYQGLPFREIGQLLEMNEQSVKNQVQRILKKMRIVFNSMTDDQSLENVIIQFFLAYSPKKNTY